MVLVKRFWAPNENQSLMKLFLSFLKLHFRKRTYIFPQRLYSALYFHFSAPFPLTLIRLHCNKKEKSQTVREFVIHQWSQEN